MENKNSNLIGAVAYILFFIPLVVDSNSEFGKFHANQGLVLLLLGIAISVAGSIIPFLGWFIIGPIGGLLVLVLAIIGIINALNGEQKELPIIGGIRLLK